MKQIHAANTDGLLYYTDGFQNKALCHAGNKIP